MLGTDCQDCQQQLWGELGRCEGGKVENRKVVVKAADVAFKKTCKSMTRRKDEIARQYRGKLIQTILDDSVVQSRYPQGGHSAGFVMPSATSIRRISRIWLHGGKA
jgi:hypothetical protein